VKDLHEGSVWTGIQRGRITNLGEISNNSKEWKKAIEKAKIHLGI
jgi:hypothetical protein